MYREERKSYEELRDRREQHTGKRGANAAREKRRGRARTCGARPIEVRERLTPARPGLGTAARVRGAGRGIPAGGEARGAANGERVAESGVRGKNRWRRPR